MEFVGACGVFSLPLGLISLVVIGLSIRGLVRLFLRRRAAPDLPAQHALLFWGGIAALLGCFGTCSGVSNASMAIMRATRLSPAVIAAGFAEALLATLWGLCVLLYALIAWLLLRFGEKRRGC